MFPAISQMIRLVSYNENNEEKKYRVTVADITDKFIMVTYPIDEQSGRTALLPDGRPLYVNYNHQDGAQYEFFSVIVRRQRENIPMLVLLKPEKESIRRIQRRNYLRVPAKLKLEFSFEADESEKIYEGYTVDISGGGIKFICSGRIQWPETKLFNCWLYLPETSIQNKKTKSEERLLFRAKIVRSPVNDGNGLQTVAVGYADIAEACRQKIIRYCFMRQLEIKNKMQP
jgi:c-di-GMP-binding flagellar brake protein YcgR